MTQPLAWRSFGWYGEEGTTHRYTAAPPAGYTRYRIEGRVTTERSAAGELSIRIRSIRVTDSQTGAWVVERGGRIILSVPDSEPPTYGERLLRDGRLLIGRARVGVGRPSEREDRIAAYRTTILALRKSGWSESKITAVAVLKRLGRTGDDSQLRGDVGGWAAYRARILRAE